MNMLKGAVRGLLLLALCSAVTVAQDQLERFAGALDGVDVDKVLSSKRLVENYVACLIHKKTCPPQIAAIKQDLPEIMKSTCGRCSKGQILKVAEGLDKLRKLYPDEFRKLTDVWDPTGEYFKNFQIKAKSLNKQGRR